MIDSNNLSDDQLNQLAAQKLAEKQSAQATDVNNVSDEQLNMLAAQKLAEKGPVPQINNNQEASLGFKDRALYSLEPLHSNRVALLKRDFGDQNVVEKNGEIYINQNDQLLPVNKPGLSTGDVADFAGALPEAAGGVVGKLAGAIGGGGVLSIPAAAGLGAAGGIVGSEFRRGLSSTLGTPQVAGDKEALSNTALSAAAGAAFGGAGQAISPYIPEIKSAIGGVADKAKAGIKSAFGAVADEAKILPGVETAADVVGTGLKASKGVFDTIKKTFELSPAKDAQELFAIADKHGIDKSILPESIEFGKESSISRASRVITEGPFGEQRLKNFNQAHAQVTAALDNAVGELTPHRLTSNIEAGDYLKESVDSARKDFFGNIHETYNNLVENAPGLKLSDESRSVIDSKLNGIRTFALGRIERGIGSQVQEGRSLMQAVNNLKNNNGSLKQTVEALQNIGEEAFKDGSAQNRIPVDKARLQKLYFDVQKEVFNTIKEHYGEDVAANLERNNGMIKDFLNNKKILGVLDKDTVSPEAIYKSLIENGDSKKIEAIKAIISPEKLQPIKAQILDTLIKRNNDGLVLFDSTINALESKKNLINALFTKEELQPVGELLGLGKRMGNPIMSTSGTGASQAFGKLLDKATGAVFNDTSIELAKKKARESAEAAVRPALPGNFLTRNIPESYSVGNIMSDNKKREFSLAKAGAQKFVRGNK